MGLLSNLSGGGIKSVQRGSVAASASDVTVTLPIAVNASKSILHVNGILTINSTTGNTATPEFSLNSNGLNFTLYGYGTSLAGTYRWQLQEFN